MKFLAAKNYALPFVRATYYGIVQNNKLDAIVYPTSPRRPATTPALPGERFTYYARASLNPLRIAPYHAHHVP